MLRSMQIGVRGSAVCSAWRVGCMQVAPMCCATCYLYICDQAQLFWTLLLAPTCRCHFEICWSTMAVWTGALPAMSNCSAFAPLIASAHGVMVSTRSGRVVSAVAGQGTGEPTPGRGASSTRGARNGNGKAGASSKAPIAADATTGSLSLAGYGGTFDATMDQRQEDQDAVAAQQQLPKLTERKVLLSPRRGTPPASPSPAASPAQPSGQRMASPTSPASPSVASWAAGSAAAAAAQHLSAVPLPDESDEDQEQRQQQHGQTAAAHPQQKQAPPSHPSTRHAGAQRPPGFTVLLSALILCALCAAATLTLCTPGALTPPLLTRLSIPPASQSLLLGLPSNPACQHVQPVSQLAQQHLSRLAPHVEQYAQLLHGTAQSYTTVLLQQVQQLVEHCRSLIAHLHQSCASLTRAGQEGFTPSTPSGHAGQEPALAPGLHHAHARQVLQAAVPLVASSSAAVAEAWEAAAADAAAKQKALGVLLHCSSSDRCAAAAGKLLGNNGSDSGDSVAACAVDLHLDGGSGQEAAGQLQQRLTSLLAPLQASSTGSRSGSSGGACKGLVVVVRSLEAAPAAVVAVLSNALSESGNLQAGGSAVSMQRATFVFPVTLQPADVHSLNSASDGGDALREADSPWDGPSDTAAPTPIPAEQGRSVESDSPDSSDGESTSDAPRAPGVPSPAAAAARESEEVQLLLSSWASDAEALLAFSRWAKSALGSRQAAVWSSTDSVHAVGAEEAAGQQQEQQREALRRAFRRRIDLVLQA